MSMVLQMRRRMMLIGALIQLLLLRGRVVVSALWTNAGMLMLRDELLALADRASGTYPAYGAMEGDLRAVRAVQANKWMVISKSSRTLLKANGLKSCKRVAALTARRLISVELSQQNC